MYHVGVTAYLRSLGIINSSVKFAGAPGGSVAAAFSCSKASGAQGMCRSAVASLSVACRLAFSCSNTLDATLRTSLLAALPANVATDCSNRLWVAVTNAAANPAADTKVSVTVDVASSNETDQRVKLSAALAASSYLPCFSGPSSVTRPGAPVAYDGVGTDPLPALPGERGGVGGSAQGAELCSLPTGRIRCISSSIQAAVFVGSKPPMIDVCLCPVLCCAVSPPCYSVLGRVLHHHCFCSPKHHQPRWPSHHLLRQAREQRQLQPRPFGM